MLCSTPLCFFCRARKITFLSARGGVLAKLQTRTLIKPTVLTSRYHKLDPTQTKDEGDVNQIVPNILHCTGYTPLVRLCKIQFTARLACELLGKCEFLNPSGSIKDRVALHMVEQAEKERKIKPGDILVAPTSGNFGVSLAMVAAIKGYKCVTVVPDKVSNEKVDLMVALGARVEKTSTLLKFNHPESEFELARRLVRETPRSYLVDQYQGEGGIRAHRDTTAQEIISACDGRVDMLVCGVGSGGTISGVARELKERYPQCVTIGVDPLGSAIAVPPELNVTSNSFYQLEGLGYDFVPHSCDRAVVDKWYKCNDIDSFTMARRLIKEEGLLCGGSSGAAVDIAVKAARDYKLQSGQTVVIILPDTAHNYNSKMLNKAWLAGLDYNKDISQTIATSLLWWWSMRVSCLEARPPLNVTLDLTISEALDVLCTENLEQLPVISPDTQEIAGITSATDILRALTTGRAQLGDQVSKALHNRFYTVSPDACLGHVATLLQTEPYVAVVHQQRRYLGRGNEASRTMIFSLISRLDLLFFITRKCLPQRPCSTDTGNLVVSATSRPGFLPGISKPK